MTYSRARHLAWAAFALWGLFLVAGAVLELATKRGPGQSPPGLSDTLFSILISAFPVVGIVILARQPRNTIGWILMAIGLLWAIPLGSYGGFALSRGLPGGPVALALSEPLWVPPIVVMGTFLLLRFPSGRLLSERWGKVEWLAWIALWVPMVVVVLAPGEMGDTLYPNLANPLGVAALKPLLDVLIPLVLLIPVAILASAASLVLRYRRATGTERLQLKWLVAAAAAVAVVYLVAMVASLESAWFGHATPVWVGAIQSIAVSSFMLIPIAIGFAILKYRLYEIDVVINKALVYGTLAAFITAVYVAIVVGIGHAVGTRGSPNVALSVVATAVVAFAFQPVRERVQRLANRFVYGKRATPYEVMSAFASSIGGTYSTDEIGPAMARLLVEGTGARRAEVWLQTDRDLRLEAGWPDRGTREASVLPLGSRPPTDELSRVFPVTHGDHPLGYLVIRKGAGDAVTPADDKLVSDVAGQAGLILRNVRLIEDLRASRRRLIDARDEERRKLERDLHDGAQQRLVALSVLYGLAGQLADPLMDGQREAMGDLAHQAHAALDTLRDLARGIYPPLLADQGLVPALEAQATRAGLPVHVLATGIGRYSRDIEAAVYFCCLEALQNIAKYAEARQALIRLQEVDCEIRFEVEDDGRGFDPDSTPLGSGMTNMSDRLAAIGGFMDLRSRPGSGTTVSGNVPIGQVEQVLEPVK
jgi:signal transduction histidine kinase